jgi:hypothetical protein
MTLGADRKKIAALGVLVVIGGYVFYSNVLSGPSSSPPDHSSGAAVHTSPLPPQAPSYAVKPAATRKSLAASRANEEFRPTLKPPRPEERVDPMSIDPTLRLDLLAKVQGVEMQGGNRNLFQFSTAPPPPLPKEPVVPLGKGAVAGNNAKQPPPGPPQPPPAAPPPPILLKYYGYSSAHGDNHKHAFFLDGDDILVAGECDMVKKRYRVVRIGVNSLVMEDTQFKHEQTLPLQEEAAG